MKLSLGKIGMWIAALPLAAVCAVGHAAPVASSGFEENPAVWTLVPSASFDTSKALQGGVSLKFAGRVDGTVGSGSATYNSAIPLSSSSGYLLSFWVGGGDDVDLAKLLVSLGSVSSFADSLYALDGNGDVISQTASGIDWYKFTMGISGSLGGTLSFVSSALQNTLFVDDLSLECATNCVTSQPVPEPGSLAVVGLALASCFAVMQRRRKS